MSDFVDVILPVLPKDLDEDSGAPGGFHAIVEVPIPGTGATFFHCLLDPAQVDFRTKGGKSFVKSLSSQEAFKKVIEKKDGTAEDCPLHVFGDSYKDSVDKKIYFADDRKSISTVEIDGGREVTK